jgi:hypothetical protein
MMMKRIYGVEWALIEPLMPQAARPKPLRQRAATEWRVYVPSAATQAAGKRLPNQRGEAVPPRSKPSAASPVALNRLGSGHSVGRELDR